MLWQDLPRYRMRESQRLHKWRKRASQQDLKQPPLQRLLPVVRRWPPRTLVLAKRTSSRKTIRDEVSQAHPQRLAAGAYHAAGGLRPSLPEGAKGVAPSLEELLPAMGRWPPCAMIPAKRTSDRKTIRDELSRAHLQRLAAAAYHAAGGLRPSLPEGAKGVVPLRMPTQAALRWFVQIRSSPAQARRSALPPWRAP